MADANKRINLAAPLLSVRRHGGAGNGGGAETAATGLPLPAYKADATSEPRGHHVSAVVPFGWEHRPGHPKSVRTRRPPPGPPAAEPPPPLAIVDVDDPTSRVTRNPTTAVVTVASDREERCSDALSRDDVVSCVTVNCSATGLSLSDAAARAVAGAGTRSMPCARGSVMMDRFLPAAHAVAAGSPQSAFRKARSARAAVELGARTAGTGGDRLAPAQRRAPLQRIATYRLPPLPPSGKNDDDDNDDDDDDDSDAHSTAGFAARRCGLLSTRCVTLLLSGVARRGAGTPFQEVRRESLKPPPPRSRNGQQLLQHTGDDHGMISQQSWEEVYIKSLLRSSGPSGLMGPAAAVASELDRTVRELYRRRDGRAVRPKASHLGLLLVLDRSNEHVSPARKLSRTGDDTPLLLKAATTKSSPDGDKQLGRGRDAAADAGGGGYGFPLLLEDKEAVAGREMALSPQPMLPLPLPKSPSESWLSRALPSVSTRRPPATSFLGLHVQPKKRAALPWCSNLDSSKNVHRDRQRQIRVYDLQK